MGLREDIEGGKSPLLREGERETHNRTNTIPRRSQLDKTDANLLECEFAGGTSIANKFPEGINMLGRAAGLYERARNIFHRLVFHRERGGAKKLYEEQQDLEAREMLLLRFIHISQ